MSTVARTRNENDIVPLDVSVLKGKGGKGKDGKSKDGKNKDGKVKAKGKDDKDKTDSKSNANKNKKCFYRDKIVHVKSECRKKKQDDEEREATPLAQNSLASSPSTLVPPGLANVPTNSSMVSTSSLRQIAIPSHVTDDDFHSAMRIFALNARSHTDRVMVDSGAPHSACPSDYASEHEVREGSTQDSVSNCQWRTPRASWCETRPIHDSRHHHENHVSSH